MRILRTRANPVQYAATKGKEISFQTLSEQFIDSRRAKEDALYTIKHYEQSIRKLKAFFCCRSMGVDSYHRLPKEEILQCGAAVKCSVLDDDNLDADYREFLYMRMVDTVYAPVRKEDILQRKENCEKLFVMCFSHFSHKKNRIKSLSYQCFSYMSSTRFFTQQTKNRQNKLERHNGKKKNP